MANRSMEGKFQRSKRQVQAYAQARDMLDRCVPKRLYRVTNTVNGKVVADGVPIEECTRYSRIHRIEMVV